MRESKNLSIVKQILLKTALLMMILAAAFSIGVTSQAKTSTKAKTKTSSKKKSTKKKKKKLTKAQIRAKNLKRWYHVCASIGKTMAKKHFRYSNGGVAKSFKTALRKGKKRCNCARYVCWCLQEYGAISQGKTFHASSGGGISKSFKRWGNKVKIIKVYKSPGRAHLKPGDVCLWDGVPHVCIYAGRNNAGKTMWFDGGKVATRSNSEGSPYKKYGRRHLGYLDHRTVSYVIRIKDLQ